MANIKSPSLRSLRDAGPSGLTYCMNVPSSTMPYIVSSRRKDSLLDRPESSDHNHDACRKSRHRTDRPVGVRGSSCAGTVHPFVPLFSNLPASDANGSRKAHRPGCSSPVIPRNCCTACFIRPLGAEGPSRPLTSPVYPHIRPVCS